MADELRAQTLAWRGAGGEEAQRGSARAADVATLGGGFSRLVLSDDPGPLRAPPRGPGCGRAPRPLCPDWVVPGPSPSPPAPPGLQSPRSPPGLQGGYRPGAPQSDRRPPRRQPADPWALPPGAGWLPGRSAWVGSRWDEDAPGGALGSVPQAAGPEADSRARARTVLCSTFPPHHVDSVMALFPELSDIARLVLLIQRFQRSGAPVGKP